MGDNLDFTDITMNRTPYFTGDDIWIKFTVGDSDGDITPSSANITLLKSDNSQVGPTAATINNNEVSYKIDSTHTLIVGQYRAYIIMELPTYGERTHRVEFEALANPERWPK